MAEPAVRIDKLRAFEAAVAPIFVRLPFRLAYEATTLRGRRVRVHAEYDPGWSDTVGPVEPYASVKRVFDAATGELLVDGAIVNEDPENGIGPAELEQLEAAALSACEMALLSGSFGH